MYRYNVVQGCYSIRAQLITARNAMANQPRGLLKLFGLRLGVARTMGRRAERLTALCPDLKPLFAPLVAAIEAVEQQLRVSTEVLEARATADEDCVIPRQSCASKAVIPAVHFPCTAWSP